MFKAMSTRYKYFSKVTFLPSVYYIKVFMVKTIHQY